MKLNTHQITYSPRKQYEVEPMKNALNVSQFIDKLPKSPKLFCLVYLPKDIEIWTGLQTRHKSCSPLKSLYKVSNVLGIGFGINIKSIPSRKF